MTLEWSVQLAGDGACHVIAVDRAAGLAAPALAMTPGDIPRAQLEALAKLEAFRRLARGG